VRTLAEGVLGKEAVDTLLDQALDLAVQQLKAALVQTGADPAYAELATAMGTHAGDFVLTNGVAILQSDIQAIVETGANGDREGMQRQLADVCQKVIGADEFNKVMNVLLTAVVEAASAQLQDAGLPGNYAGVLIQVAQKTQGSGDEYTTMLAQVQALPALASEPEQLMKAVRTLAEGVLGKEAVDTLLDQDVPAGEEVKAPLVEPEKRPEKLVPGVPGEPLMSTAEAAEEHRDADFDELLFSLFQRYDLDKSGTINDSTELHQLTTNLTFSLVRNNMFTPRAIPKEKIEIKVGEVGELNDANAWSLEAFSAWYKSEVMPHDDGTTSTQV